jgi:hypothetical protein
VRENYLNATYVEELYLQSNKIHDRFNSRCKTTSMNGKHCHNISHPKSFELRFNIMAKWLGLLLHIQLKTLAHGLAILRGFCGFPQSLLAHTEIIP